MLMFRDMVGIGVILLLILVELFDDKNNPIWFILAFWGYSLVRIKLIVVMFICKA